MKKLFYLLCFLSLGFFMSCSDDDDHKSSEALMTKMTFDESFVVSQPVIEGNKVTFYVSYETEDESLKELVPVIEVSSGATVNPKSGSKVDFSGGSVKFTVTAEDGVTKNEYTVTCKRVDNSEALIYAMTFENEIVIAQPEIKDKTIVFYVSQDATDEDLKVLIPIIDISPGATVDPALGSKVDFSEGSVKFTVTSQDGKTVEEYTVSVFRLGKYDFEEWALIDTDPEDDNSIKYYEPIGGWGTSNTGAVLLLAMDLVDRFVVTKTDEAYSGNAAARLETVDSQGLSFLGFQIPKITSGSLFLGSFKNPIDTENTLKNTLFGIPSNKKPLRVEGYYKYIPGEVFYNCPDQDKISETEIDENEVDQCAINAILYEIENDDDEYLTGADAYTSPKLVARAELKDGSAKEEYTPFSIDLEYKYGKSYDPSKKYRFAIICSSSKRGDEFSGAPGSVLYVDDIEVISE